MRRVRTGLGLAATAAAALMAVSMPARATADEPFAEPQYLVHVTGHSTREGPVRDDILVILPEAPGADGQFATADGYGGLFHWSSDSHSGPYNRPSEVCSAAVGQFADGETVIAALGSGAEDVDCARFGAPTTTNDSPLNTWDPFGTGVATTEAEVGGCAPHGVVVDAFGEPVPDIHVVLDAGGVTLETATLADGSYSFEEIAAEPITVSVYAEEWAGSPSRYIVYYRQHGAVLRSDQFDLADDLDCRRDFDMRSIPSNYASVGPPVEHWPDLTQIYQGIHRAWALSDMLGSPLDYGLPLQILSFCDDSNLGCEDDGAAFFGSTSSGSNVIEHPYIYFGPAASLLTAPEWPDNREYHEFGHYVLASLYNGGPDNSSDDQPEPNHGGYANASSTDSWSEGFAEFYSAMVSKYIDHDPAPERYAVGSTEVDLGDAWQPWEYEELSIASLLVRLEQLVASEAPEPPRQQRTFEVRDFTEVDDPTYGRLIVGHIANTTAGGASRGTVAGAIFVDEDGQRVDAIYGSTIPVDLAANGGEGLFVLPVPQGITYHDVVISAFEGKPPAPAPQVEALDVTLADLWSVIVNGTSSKTLSQAHLHDIEDVYHALKQAFGGRGTITDEGLDTIDQLFVEHGLFDDSDGDRRYAPGDAIGVTSHPAFGAQAGCNWAAYQFCSPARDERSNLGVPPIFAAQVSIESIESSGRRLEGADVYVEVLHPERERSYGYLATPDRHGELDIAVPPAGSGATVILIAVAPGYTPAVLGAVDSAEFWDDVSDSGGTTSLEFRADLHPEPVGAAGGRNVRPLIALIVGGLLLIVAVTVLARRTVRTVSR